MSNSQANLSVIGTFQIIQDAITELTGKLGIDGLTEKAKYNAFWVFAKTKVKFFKNLVWNQKVSINTFISQISLAKMYADVEVKDTSGRLAFYSRTELCALDLETGRIRKVATVGVTDAMLSHRKTMEVEFEKFDAENLPPLCNVKIKYTNIDFCHHTNNLEYIRLIMDTYTVKDMEQRQIKEMEINYLNQSYEGDELGICKRRDGDAEIFAIVKNLKPVVKCKIEF